MSAVCFKSSGEKVPDSDAGRPRSRRHSQRGERHLREVRPAVGGVAERLIVVARAACRQVYLSFAKTSSESLRSIGDPSIRPQGHAPEVGRRHFQTVGNPSAFHGQTGFAMEDAERVGELGL
jgi:hypothetical protein